MSPQSQAVLDGLAGVHAQQDEIKQAALAMMGPRGTPFYTIDLVAIAALNRAAALTAAFGLLIERRNLVSAAAILRMQLDSALRFSALWRVVDPHAAASAILKGTRINRLKDRDGQKLTDARLQELMSTEKDWVPEVYEKTSGFVHFSDAHVASAIFPSPNDPDAFRFKVDAEDEDVPDQLYLEAISAFWASTDLFLEYVEGWTAQKNGRIGLAARAPEIGRAPVAQSKSAAT
jgi:hypothetical protein